MKFVKIVFLLFEKVHNFITWTSL